ncbi:Transposable element Tcb2 transposase [Blattella germanica]|nr:Transposable element Tcb2 transposase [Blattella germanica]
MLRDRTSSSTVIAHRQQTIRGVAVSALPVRRRLQEYGVHSRRPATAPNLKPSHRKDRLNFAREYKHWTDEDWASALFTDESRFCLRSADRRQIVWRRPGEHYSPCTMIFTTPFNGGSVMVWAGISLNYRTELIIIGGRSLNSDRYIADCLMDHVVPFAAIIGVNFLLMLNNACPHVSRVARTFLQDVEINTLDWLARSPDLNPIERV